MKLAVLVTGSIGNIGSHVANKCHYLSWRVIIFDNLFPGRLDLIPDDFKSVHGDILRRHNCRAALNFSGFITVSWSFENPLISCTEQCCSEPEFALDVWRGVG